MIVDGQLLVARADASGFLRPADAVFQDGAVALDLGVNEVHRVESRYFVGFLRVVRVDTTRHQPILYVLRTVN